MRVIRERLDSREGERGAVAIIVTIALIAIFAMVVLTVDVGGLLLERRSMVNAADAAALAAAQSCARTDDTDDPEAKADEFAKENVTDLPADGIVNITEMPGCDTSSGHVSVRYSEQHELFFAAVLPGQDNQGTITTVATAAWGPIGGGFPIPVVLDSSQLQGACKVPSMPPDPITKGTTCAFWYNNGDETLGDANWGFMNLSLWNVGPGDKCSNAGSNDRRDWIIDGYPEMRVLNGNPPGTAPTYVCGDTGASSSNWKTLEDAEGTVKFFPVNDCGGQLDKGGNVSPCPSTPEYYDIIGFTSLLIEQVYKGNDAAAIGTAGANGICNKDFQPFDADGDATTGLTFSLNAFGTSSAGGQCFASVPDAINASTLVIKPLKSSLPAYVQCAPGQTSGCHYTYNSATRTVTWTGASTQGTGKTESDDDLHVSFGWSNVGTPGACGIHPPDPNAKCVVTSWQGFTTGPGPVGGGTNFGVSAVKLCNLEFAAGCPDEG